jgi:transposase-like protein
MAHAIFAAQHFHDEEAARTFFEGLRWPNGPVCGHCGEATRKYATKRPGRWRCGNPECRKDYTATTGTVMESSHVKLHLWLQAFHLAASSKKGFSAHQLHRTLGITYKSAWFMHHRIMEAMREGGLASPLGGQGKVVEADETYIGRRKDALQKKGGGSHKMAVVSLVERGGKVRSFHVPTADKKTVSRIVMENIVHESRLHTDESRLYFGANRHFRHQTVQHNAREYVRGDVTTNTVEGYFSIFKRGMKGVYQHCGEKHLHRYLAEFDFRYNRRIALGYTDEMRTAEAVQGAVGKRLTYKKPH